MAILIFILMCFAISNITYILTTVDLLDRPRNWFQKIFPKLGKIAVCQYCQSFWLSGIGSFVFVTFLFELDILGFLIWVVLWNAGHKFISLLNLGYDLVLGFHDKYLSDHVLPINANVFLTLENSEKTTIPVDSVDITQQTGSNKEVTSSIQP